MKSCETVVFNVSLPGMCPLPPQLFGNTSPLPKPTQRGHVDEAKKVGTGSREETP